METASTGALAELRAYADLLEEQVTHLQQALDSSSVIDQAKGAVAARCEVPTDVASEIIHGLARSQGRDLQEFCKEIVANRGRLDGLEPHRPVGLHT